MSITIAAIAERIRREDPLAAKIAEECRKAIPEKAEPSYQEANHFVYQHPAPVEFNDKSMDQYTREKTLARATLLLQDMMPDIALNPISTWNLAVPPIESVYITFRARQGASQ